MGLLELPGELRNAIYEACREPNDVILVYHSYRRPLPGRGHGGFRNLMRVCRQIRNEFSPMYLARTAFCVTFPDVNKYIRDFYPTARVSREVTREYSGRLHIEPMAEDSSMDILSIMNLRSLSPNIDLLFLADPEYPKIAQNTNELFAMVQPSAITLFRLAMAENVIEFRVEIEFPYRSDLIFTALHGDFSSAVYWIAPFSSHLMKRLEVSPVLGSLWEGID